VNVSRKSWSPDGRWIVFTNPTGAQPAQELPPERLGLGLTDVQADDLTAAALVDAVGDHQRLVLDPAGLAAPVTDE